MISVLFGYRDDGGPRDVLFGYVLRWWHRHYPEAQICVGRNFDDPFHRGKARNAAHHVAETDILIIADADTVPDVTGVDLAVEMLLEEQAPWVLPYGLDRYYNLSEDATLHILKHQPNEIREPSDAGDWEHKLTSWAGCLVIPRAAWDAVGGYDERFIGWGYEDNAFQFALDTVWGAHRRIDAYCCHLWHAIEPGTTFDSPFIAKNRSLYRIYEQANGDPDRMRQVLAR